MKKLCIIIIMFSLFLKADKVQSITIDDELIEYFDIAFNTLKEYNPNIDSITVEKIVNTAYNYSLTNDSSIFKLCLGQLLVESNATHKNIKTGRIIISSGGAIGICQITSSTAFEYLSKLANYDHLTILENLGCSSIDFITDSSFSRKTKILKTKEWLMKKTNNIAMWGLILNYNIMNYNNINKALIAYNVGGGGLIDYIKNGKNLQKHKYITMINSKVN